MLAIGEVIVEPAGVDLHVLEPPEYKVPTISHLFRNEIALDTVLKFGLESYQAGPQAEPFHVMSIGCSFGAEVDSALAYLTHNVPELGAVSATGIDINPHAVEAAKRGKYSTYASVLPEIQDELELYGFTFESGPVGKWAHISAEQLRAKHDVTFVEADMRKPTVIDAEPADVVLCNNIFYHLSPDDASDLVLSAADYLANGGIMSWEYPSGGSVLTMGMSDVNYTVWRVQTGQKLARDGILPIAFNSDGAPHIFYAEK